MRLFVKLKDGVPELWDLTFADVRRLCPPNISLPESPEQFEEIDISDIGFETFQPVECPTYNPVTHGSLDMAPSLKDGAWVQQWEIVPLDAETVAANQHAAEAGRVASLWQAAHDYEYAQISGSAIGLLAMGVMTGKPKCLAVHDWIKSIWTLYYFRKATGETSTDFSSCGECPYTVPELMAELGL